MKNKKDFQALWNLHEETVKAIKDMTNSIKELNDIHLQGIMAINENTNEIRKLVNTNQVFIRFIMFSFLLLVIAITLLAGAEKIIKVIPLLNGKF